MSQVEHIVANGMLKCALLYTYATFSLPFCLSVDIGVVFESWLLRRILPWAWECRCVFQVFWVNTQEWDCWWPKGQEPQDGLGWFLFRGTSHVIMEGPARSSSSSLATGTVCRGLGDGWLRKAHFLKGLLKAHGVRPVAAALVRPLRHKGFPGRTGQEPRGASPQAVPLLPGSY